MISLQSLLRLSNGNKLILFSLLASVLSSCAVMRSGDSGNAPSKVYMPDDKNEQVNKQDTVKPDTLRWESDEQTDNINKNEEDKVPEKKKSGKKDSYRIDILIPMDSYSVVGSLEDIEQGPANSMLHYYGGVIMALVNLKEKGANIEVNVYDAPPDQDRTDDYLITAKKNKPDLIIGPNEKEQLKKINNFCAENEISVVAPWRPIANVSNDNMNYIQLKPSLDTYYERISRDIDERYNADEVYLVGQDDSSGKSRIKNINSIHLKSSGVSTEYNTVFVTQVKLESDYPLFNQIFTGNGKRKAIILPNWSHKDEDFLFACLRKINLEKGSYNVEVYGMPIMLNSEKLSYDLFKSLNIRIISPNFLDDTDYVVRESKADFYKQFNVFPDPDAYEGFDMMSFIGSNLLDYGKYFINDIENMDFDLQTTSYRLVKKIREQENQNTEAFVMPYYENKKLFIIGFENNKFVKLR